MKLTGRVLTIGHLCLALWFLMWALFQPWTGEHFAKRSLQALYEYVIGNERSAELPPEEMASFREGYEALRAWPGTPLGELTGRGVYLLTAGSSPYAQAWLWLSLVVCFCLLYQIRGALQAVWVLPLVTVLFAMDNESSGVVRLPPDAELFPSEAYLTKKYMDTPLSGTVGEQQVQLSGALDKYFVAEWSKDGSVEGGSYWFQVARLHRWEKVPLGEISPTPSHEMLPRGWLVLYCLWNVVFALGVSLSERRLAHSRTADRLR